MKTPVFVPYIRESKLRKNLQQVDDTLGECLRSPGVQFVERCGGQTLVELLGTSNPWAKGLRCASKGCLPCKGRDMLGEEEALRPIPESGQSPLSRPINISSKMYSRGHRVQYRVLALQTAGKNISIYR